MYVNRYVGEDSQGVGQHDPEPRQRQSSGPIDPEVLGVGRWVHTRLFAHLRRHVGDQGRLQREWKFSGAQKVFLNRGFY